MKKREIIEFAQRPKEQYFSKQSLKITGDIFQFKKFGKEFAVGQKQYKNDKKEKVEGQDDSAEKLSEEEIRIKSFRRAKTKLVDYINTNVFRWYDLDRKVFVPVFLTLTFEENITDIKKANYQHTKFIQRLNWHITGKHKLYLKYVSVIEFQKRGAVHFHIILFNMPFIPKIKIKELWGNGWIKVKIIDDVNNVGFYVTKYMSKNFDDPRLKKNKCYFISKYLYKPIIIHIEELINIIKRFMPEEAKESERLAVPIDYLKSMDYYRYNLKKYPEVIFQIKDYIDSNIYENDNLLQKIN